MTTAACGGRWLDLCFYSNNQLHLLWSHCGRGLASLRVQNLTGSVQRLIGGCDTSSGSETTAAILQHTSLNAFCWKESERKGEQKRSRTPDTRAALNHSRSIWISPRMCGWGGGGHQSCILIKVHRNLGGTESALCLRLEPVKQ